MTLQDIRLYFGSGYRFKKLTNMSPSSWANWFKWGYIPVRSQIKIERLTNGALKADISDGEKV